MKKFTLLILMGILSSHAYAQKKKFIVAEKIKFEEKSVQENKQNDEELKEDMDTFLGFGFRLSITNVEEPLKEKENTTQKKKVGLRFQLGFQMPKYIKTQPPQKLFKTGWDLGIVK